MSVSLEQKQIVFKNMLSYLNAKINQPNTLKILTKISDLSFAASDDRFKRNNKIKSRHSYI